MDSTVENRSRRYRVKWHVSPTHDVQLTCSLVAGLGGLARSGAIDLDMSLIPTSTGLYRYRTMRMDVTNPDDGDCRKVAVDLSDLSDRFSMQVLEDVDVYFKRNYWPDATQSLPDELRRKVRPAGITFGSYLPKTRRLLLKSAFMTSVARLREPRKFPLGQSARRLYGDIDQISSFLANASWERTKEDAVKPRVVFQTRLWGKKDGTDVDRSAVNAERIGLVTALRDAFGSDDSIGLLDTQTSGSMAPGAILSRKVTRAEYAQQLRTSLIAVNSHGLDGSAGFKVAESLAGGCALVSQPFRIELPEPLEPNIHYLPFESADECVAQCRSLLENPEAAEKMRATNLDYFRRNVSPQSMAQNLLDLAFNSQCLSVGDEAGIHEALRGSA